MTKVFASVYFFAFQNIDRFIYGAHPTLGTK
jgi:hypothetical protein